MKIKQHIYVSVLGMALLAPLSCSKDFLEQPDTRNISESTLFHKAEDGIALVNSIYNTFDDDPNSDQFMKKAMWYIANYLPQDFHNWGNDIFWLDYQINVDNFSLKTLWEHFYKGISTANSAFPIIEKMRADNVLDQNLADRLTGEAYFLRGLFYYYLGATFGGVPLELETVTDAGLHPRNTQDEVFAAIESDMTKAASLLPWKEDLPAEDLGRATKGAALGYLGAAQMWLKKYAEAVTTYNQLTGKYQLMENFVDIHEYNHQNNKESLFEVQYKFPSGGNRSWGHSNDSHWISSFGIPWEVLNDFGYDYADPRLSFSFESGDTRRTCTVLGPGDVHPSPAIQIKNYPHVIDGFNSGDPKYKGPNGEIINTCGTFAIPWRGRYPNATNNDSTSGYYSVKFWRDPNIIDNQNFMSDQNAIMLRLGEVLVSKAEAQFRSGDETGARASLQLIRDRAWGKLTNPSVVVPPLGSDLLKAIISEYRHEIAGEMSLWFDLRRSGEHINYVKDNFGKTIPQGHDLMPIPSTAIASNETLTQNPGY